MNAASSPLPAPQPQLPSWPEYQPPAESSEETSTDLLSHTTTATIVPAPEPTEITITASTSQSIITVSTTRSFSGHGIKVAPTHTSNTTSSTKRVRPSETPYGTTSSSNTKRRIMLTVSLAVVFGVLTSMGLVVCCLFWRRRKRQMNVSGKCSNIDPSSKDELDNMMAAAVAVHRRNSTLVLEGSGAPEMYEGGYSSNRDSTLCLGPGLHRQNSAPLNQMLTPALSAKRRASMGSGYWSSSTWDHRERVANRKSHHELYYGTPSSDHSPLLNPLVNGGIGALTSHNYDSREQLLLHHHQYPSVYSSNVSSRSSLLPGLHPQQDELQNSSSNFRVDTTSLGNANGYHYPLQPPFYGHPPAAPGAVIPQSGVYPISDSYRTFNAGGSSSSLNTDGAIIRPQSIMLLNNTTTLSIPPSITSRRRSTMKYYNINVGQSLPSRLLSSPITEPVSSQTSTPIVTSGSDRSTTGNTANAAPEMISGLQPSSDTPGVPIAPAPSMTVAAESCTSQDNDMPNNECNTNNK